MKFLLKLKGTKPKNSKIKWEKICSEQETVKIDWKRAYTLPLKCTKETKLKTFQFRFLHRRTATHSKSPFWNYKGLFIQDWNQIKQFIFLL